MLKVRKDVVAGALMALSTATPAGAWGLTGMSRPQLAAYRDASAAAAPVTTADPAPVLPDIDAQEGIPQAPPDSAAEHAAREAQDDTEVDIYAPKKNRKPFRFKPARSPGDNDVILAPSARPLDEGERQVSLDELLLWRVQLGVSDDFTLEANSLWGLSIGLNGKYALVRKNNTAVSLQLGAGAFTVEKSINWAHAGLLYTKDFARGALHLGAYAIFAHSERGRSYVLPQATAAGEVRVMKHVTAIGEVGFGNDVLHAAGLENNTGFVNLALRLDGGNVFATGGLVMPTNDHFVNSSALGIPALRLGGRF